MDNIFQVVFYEQADGRCPVAEFLTEMDEPARIVMMHRLDDLELFGGRQERSPARLVRDGIYEVHWQRRREDVFHVLLFFDENKVVLTHGFHGQSVVVPAVEVEFAKGCQQAYFEQMYRQGDGLPHYRNVRPTHGPLWRPELDAILADAAQRSQGAPTEHGKMRELVQG